MMMVMEEDGIIQRQQHAKASGNRPSFRSSRFFVGPDFIPPSALKPFFHPQALYLTAVKSLAGVLDKFWCRVLNESVYTEHRVDEIRIRHVC
ncbi:uncharacterized protein BDW70DRAFT_25047 [Aspergillus foveolatus]|uniref:uncharacterized protein n=1 Tax=Aspergillus foveolatus TaxID=210207 RepID=UPI003CCD41EC